MLKDLDEEDDEEGFLWCLRGYPFTCPFELPFYDLDDPATLFALDEVCRDCPRRLEYERRHRSFAV